MTRIALVVAAVALAGCDSKAKASDPQSRDKSKEFESCAVSTQCDGDLRCFDQQCRRTARSMAGDYLAALGNALRAKGDIEGAIEAYNQALHRYDQDKIALPPDIDCGYGAALAAGKSKKEHAELGARVLHRCALALPGGSSLRLHALADLATLADVGLDPSAINGTKLADVYLAGNASPSSDKVGVTVTATPQPAGKTYQLIPDKLAEPDIKKALVACWEQYNGAAHKDVMAISIGVKVEYVPSQYDDESGSIAIKTDPPVALPAGSPEAAADACVRAVVEPAVKGLALHDAFATRLTITVK